MHIRSLLYHRAKSTAGQYNATNENVTVASAKCARSDGSQTNDNDASTLSLPGANAPLEVQTQKVSGRRKVGRSRSVHL